MLRDPSGIISAPNHDHHSLIIIPSSPPRGEGGRTGQMELHPQDASVPFRRAQKDFFKMSSKPVGKMNKARLDGKGGGSDAMSDAMGCQLRCVLLTAFAI